MWVRVSSEVVVYGAKSSFCLGGGMVGIVSSFIVPFLESLELMALI